MTYRLVSIRTKEKLLNRELQQNTEQGEAKKTVQIVDESNKEQRVEVQPRAEAEKRVTISEKTTMASTKAGGQKQTVTAAMVMDGRQGAVATEKPSVADECGKEV